MNRIGFCNGCGEEGVPVRFLKLPDDDEGWSYCEKCFVLVKAQMLEEIGEWDYGEFE